MELKLGDIIQDKDTKVLYKICSICDIKPPRAKHYGMIDLRHLRGIVYSKCASTIAEYFEKPTKAALVLFTGLE